MDQNTINKSNAEGKGSPSTFREDSKGQISRPSNRCGDMTLEFLFP